MPFEDPRLTFDVLWSSGAAAAVAALPRESRERLDPGLASLVAQTAGPVRGGAVSRPTPNVRGWVPRWGGSTRTGICSSPPPSRSPPSRRGATFPPAPPIAQWPGWTPFTYPFNLTQQPAVAVPCGFTSDRLPIGLQIIGRAARRGLVLRVARAYEAHHPQPTLADHEIRSGGRR